MLFDEFEFSGLRLCSRIVRSATYEKLADDDGFMTEDLLDLYSDLAKGGAGLIITGNMLVHPSGRSAPKAMCVHSDIYIDGLRELASTIHDSGGLIVAQVSHGGRQCAPLLLGGAPAIAPSAVFDPVYKHTPKAMTDAEIWSIIDAFKDAGSRVKSAGFDGIQLHGAHGYLISQFLSPHTNRRDDYWGGDEGRRFHFLEEVYKAVRSAVGNDFPILIKMNSNDYIDGGLLPAESLRIAKRLEELGIDAIEVSGSMIESSIKTIRPFITSPEKEAYLRDSGRLFKKGLNVPIIVTGGMRSLSVMEDVLSKNEADLIGMSRPLIKEPNLPNLLKEGKEKSSCVSCNGCIKFIQLDRVKCVDKEKS